MGDDMRTQVSASSADRRARLLAAKLAAVVGDQRSDGAIRPGTFPPGAALLAGDRAWVLLETDVDDGTGLGPAIVWAVRNGATEIDLVADRPLTVAARRGGEFALPIRVWTLDGRQLRAVPPADIAVSRRPPASHLRFVPDIEAAGAAVVVEHGVVTGEVGGLEVCRVVDVDGGGGVRLEVGVGPHDREAFAIIHGDVPSREALAGVVAAVAAARRLDAPGHPLNRLAPERQLRWRLEHEPWLVGMVSVRHAEPPVPRRGLKQRAPCTAIGHRLDGESVVIVCSVGVDLDVVPYAADARLAAGVGAGGTSSPAETIVVLPERDLLPVTRELAGQLRHSVSLLTLSAG
jgi:hypothetical protein